MIEKDVDFRGNKKAASNERSSFKTHNLTVTNLTNLM